MDDGDDIGDLDDIDESAPETAPSSADTITRDVEEAVGQQLAEKGFIIYADRKLLTPATIARLKTKFHLPTERIEVQSDWHYQSTETPNGLSTRSTQP